MASTYIEQVNEYYKLKSRYESLIEKEKKKLLNAKHLSLREKRNEYEQIKHKCINCKRPVGSIFNVKYNSETDSRELRAVCGDKINPCPLNIFINLGYFETYSESITDIENIIKSDKNKIITYKNDLLFGYITTEEALAKFEQIKDNISDYSKILSHELTKYNEIIDNPEEKKQLHAKTIESFENINKIKESIERFNNTNDTQFVKDAVDLYVGTLTPQLKEIMNFKYKYCQVEMLDDNNYHLIQKKNTIEQLEYALVEPSVHSFVVGMTKTKQTKKNRGQVNNKTVKIKLRPVVAESSSDNEGNNEEENQAANMEQPLPQTSSVGPVFNEDGSVMWNDPVYQNMWNSLSPQYKNALLQDHQWLEDTINQYVKDRKEGKPREYLHPINLIIPPHILDDGSYDFGNPVYNNIFNTKIAKIQKDILVSMLSKSNTGDNKAFMTTLGQIIGKELGFTRY